jgi:hypothetical protein
MPIIEKNFSPKLINDELSTTDDNILRHKPGHRV